MKSEFSEFTYGFALANEIVGYFRSVITGAPILPSLIEEGRTGGGYDLKIGINGQPVFLQFKLSSYLTRKNASEWSIFGSPYYRFNLMPLSYSKQHNMLLDLENIGNSVYYSAPIFYESSDLNNYFINQQVVNNSIFISPSYIGRLPDNNEHHIIFQNKPTIAYMCSDPKEISFKSGENIISMLKSKLKDSDKRRITNKSLVDLGNKMLLIASEKNEEYKEQYEKLERISVKSQEDPFMFVSNISRILFGCEFFIISNESNN